MYKSEEVNYRNCTINIYVDEDPISPRDWDNYTTMLCFHRRYHLGDHNQNPYHSSDFSGWSEMIEQIHRDYDVLVYKPLYLYDHSGITISTGPFSCRWDSGQIGWVIITRESVKKMQGWKRITKKRKKLLKQYLQSEVNTYDQYLRGEVYGYQVEDLSGEIIDSCWGFFGSNWEENGLFEHAKPAVDYYIKQQRKQYFDRLKTMIRNHVPLQVRNSQLTKPSVL